MQLGSFKIYRFLYVADTMSSLEVISREDNSDIDLLHGGL